MGNDWESVKQFHFLQHPGERSGQEYTQLCPDIDTYDQAAEAKAWGLGKKGMTIWIPCWWDLSSRANISPVNIRTIDMLIIQTLPQLLCEGEIGIPIDDRLTRSRRGVSFAWSLERMFWYRLKLFSFRGCGRKTQWQVRLCNKEILSRSFSGVRDRMRGRFLESWPRERRKLKRKMFFMIWWQLVRKGKTRKGGTYRNCRVFWLSMGI